MGEQGRGGLVAKIECPEGCLYAGCGQQRQGWRDDDADQYREKNDDSFPSHGFDYRYFSKACQRKIQI